MMESSIAVRDAGGNVTAFQGFLLDITDRKRAEQEIRRRNRELMVLNSIGANARGVDGSASIPCNGRFDRCRNCFSLDASSLYLFDEADVERCGESRLWAHARSMRGRFSAGEPCSRNFCSRSKAVHATFLSAQGLPLPSLFAECSRKKGSSLSFLVILWSKDRIVGGLVVGSRTPREFSPADINLLIAVGSQISNAIDRSKLYEETRQAYDNLRRTQEQLLHSEKMAAVGQIDFGRGARVEQSADRHPGIQPIAHGQPDVGPLASSTPTRCTSRRNAPIASCRTC